MLKPKALTQVLGQSNSGGVKNTMLLNKEGSLLAFSGYSDKDARVIAAIAADIWSVYEGNGQNAFPEQNELEVLLLKFQNGYIAIRKVSSLLICLHSDSSTGLGMLKAKANALAEYLEEPLRKVSVSS